ncbi:MAG: ATP-binding protein, partial [Candidatus Eisenbacteria bacterium]|nr:ATP-binding protein [Candidatus Eisenbacteria bacterium]
MSRDIEPENPQRPESSLPDTRRLLEERERLQRTVQELERVRQDLLVHQEEIRAQNNALLQTRQLLEQSRDRYAELYDAAPIGYVTLDSQGVIVDINLAGAELLGKQRNRLISSPFLAHLAGPDRKLFLDHLTRCRRGDRDVQTEISLEGADGDPLPVHLVTRRRHHARSDGSFPTAMIDLRERKRAEEEKRQLALREESARLASEAKDRFLAILSHEMRTPLTPVLAAVSMLVDDPTVPAEHHPLLEMVRRNIEIEARLIDDLLDVGRIVNGQLRIDRSPVALHEIVNDVLGEVAEDVAAKGIDLTVALRAEPDQTTADAVRIRQVFWNLLRNAIKFTPEHGWITLRTWTGGDVFYTEIRDSGAGIDPSLLPDLFHPFVQEKGRQESTRGLGLGLFITRQLLEAHGGSIEAKSDGVGTGSTFLLSLPLASREFGEGEPVVRSAPKAEEPTQDRPRSMRILLVEDHRDSAAMIAMLLRSHGFEIDVARDAAEALRMLNDSHRLLISDLGLPDVDGLTLMRRIRECRQDLPAIALSGYGTHDDVQKSHEAGFREH